jgi:hypothetical protein
LSLKVFQVIEGCPIPDWKKFLGVNTNKQALLQFLGKSIVEHHDQSPCKMSAEDTLYLAGVSNDPITVKKICSEGVSDCPELFCTHEEADTRMLLHVIHADRIFGEKRTKGRIIVKSSDTDVLVLCVHYFPSLQHTDELWFQTGAISSTKDGRRFIPVHDICNSIDPVIYKILPAVHAVTGCDTTPSMFGIGKRTVFKVLKDRPSDFIDLSSLADCDIDQSVYAARKLVARLYDQKEKLKAGHVDLNKLRVRLATLKDACLAKLPTCEATFRQHILRASLQTNIWMSAHIPKPPPNSPLLFGWEKKNRLVPVFFRGQMSSDFLQDLVCTCKGKSVCLNGCICFEQNLSCTDLCPCQASELCRNVNTNLTLQRNR